MYTRKGCDGTMLTAKYGQINVCLCVCYATPLFLSCHLQFFNYNVADFGKNSLNFVAIKLYGSIYTYLHMHHNKLGGSLQQTLDELWNLFYYTRPNVSDIDIHSNGGNACKEWRGSENKWPGHQTCHMRACYTYAYATHTSLIVSANCHFVNGNLHFSPHNLPHQANACESWAFNST